MGKGGLGLFTSFVGALLTLTGNPWAGLILMVGGGIAAQKEAKREAMKAMEDAMRGLRANTRTTERAIPVLYGRQRVGGNMVWMSTEGHGGADNTPMPHNKLFIIYGISEGPIDGFEEMYFNDTKVWDARSGYLKNQFWNRYYWEYRTGTNSQAPYQHIASVHNLWDVASDCFPLTATAMVEFFYDDNVYQGIPKVTWTIRGKKVPHQGNRNFYRWTNPYSGAPNWAHGYTAVSLDGAMDPSGANSAAVLQSTTNTYGWPYIAQGREGSTDNQRYTISIYAKAGNVNKLSFEWNAGWWRDGVTTVYDLSVGSITQGIGSIQNVGSGWYRCAGTHTWSGDNTTWTCALMINQYGAANSGDYVYIWGIQGEEGEDATAYVANTGIAYGDSFFSNAGPLMVADLLTNNVYGMGISSRSINVPECSYAYEYASAGIAPNSRVVTERVDNSTVRPKYWEKNLQIPWGRDDPGMSDAVEWVVSSRHSFSLEHLPIRPYSLTIVSDLGSVYYDSPNSGTWGRYGELLGAGAAHVGSIDYETGAITLVRPPPYWDQDMGEGGPGEYRYIGDYVAKYYSDFEFSYRTKYQYISRSVYVVCGSETLVETGTVTDNVISLISSQGGEGRANYSTGEIYGLFVADGYYKNYPVDVNYRVSTRNRFSTNYPLWDSTRIIDSIRDIQQHYRGFIVYEDGKYCIHADGPENSVFSFDEDNIIAGTFKFSQPSLKDMPTKVVLKYLDAINNFTPSEASFDARSSEPGTDIEHILEMPGITLRDEAMAQAYTYANLSNLRNSISFRGNYLCSSVRAGQVVDVTHDAASWDKKLFRILSVSYAGEDKYDFAAIEHDPSAYVDDWILGPMINRNPSFFPRRNFFPPNVTSATISEYTRTLPDGSAIPTIAFNIWAVDSPGYQVDLWNVYGYNATRAQKRTLLYSDSGTKGYISPVERGRWFISIVGAMNWGTESPKTWTGSVLVWGGLEKDWQYWRTQRMWGNLRVIEGDIVAGGLLASAAEVSVCSGGRAFVVAIGNVSSTGKIAHVSETWGNQGVTYVNCFGTYKAAGHATNMSLAITSGGHLTMFNGANSDTMYFKTFDSSGTIIATATGGYTNWLGYKFATNSSGKTWVFGHYEYSSGSRILSYAPFSIWSAGQYIVGSPVQLVDTVTGVGAGVSPFFCRSYGAVVWWEYYTGTNSAYFRLMKYVFEPNCPAYALQSMDIWWESRSAGYWSTVRAFAAGYYPDRIYICMNFNPTTPNLFVGSGMNWGQYRTWMSLWENYRGPLKTMQDPEDYTEDADYQSIYLTGRPHVTQTMAWLAQPKKVGIGSAWVEVDKAAYYKIGSASNPQAVSTWIG